MLASLLSLALLSSVAQEPTLHEVAVKGTIIGSDGNPVPNGIVGAHPSLTPDGSKYWFEGGAVADSEGRFELTLKIPRTRFELSAFNPAQTEGGYVLESEKNAASVKLRLKPIYPVAYEFVIPKELKKNKVDAGVQLEEVGIWFNGPVPAKGTLRLPKGKHVLMGYLWYEANPIQQPFTVEEKPLKLAASKFKLTPFALKYGKPPLPLYHTASRGLSKPFKWKDYLGKWVLVDQWAYWCVPCCFEALPRLMKFAKDNKDKKDKFAVITLHTVPNPDSGIKDFKTLQPMLDVIQKKAWNGKPLPFPILLDLEGKTMKSWGFSSADVHFLVDPKGNIVRGDAYEVLRANGFK